MVNEWQPRQNLYTSLEFFTSRNDISVTKQLILFFKVVILMEQHTSNFYTSDIQ